MIIEFKYHCLIDLDNHWPGEHVSVDDDKGRALIARGVAVEVKPDSEPPAVREAVDPAPKTARKATSRTASK